MLHRPRGVLAAMALLAGFALSGCAETTLAVHTAKQLSRGDARPAGVYKVGEPYQINGAWYYPAEDYAYSETGIASFYGGESQGTNFHGRSTANGELYDMNALTAAHQTLPMPSLVRVTNLENGRAIVLRVNDRGPFARGRIIDVSRRSAQLLGFEAQGTARVRVEVLPEESRALKLALLKGEGGAETQTVAAVPRDSVASDALPPPPGARASASASASALPPPSATLPQVSVPGTAGRKAGRGPAPTEPIGKPAAPVITEPAPYPSSARVAATRASVPAASVPSTEVAALPVSQHREATAAVVQGPVQPTSIFIQAGAFSNYENAYRLSVRLSRYGRTKVTPIGSGPQQLFRVRLGPVNSVREADALLAEVSGAVPEARLIVD